MAFFTLVSVFQRRHARNEEIYLCGSGDFIKGNPGYFLASTSMTRMKMGEIGDVPRIVSHHFSPVEGLDCKDVDFCQNFA